MPGYFPEYSLNQPATQPQYSAIGDIGSAASAGGNVLGAAAAIPGPQQIPLGIASLGLQAVSTGADIYGKYQERQSAKQRYDDAMREWERQQAVEEEDRQRELMRQQREEAYYGGQYSQGLEDRFAGAYGGYRQGGQ